MARHIAAETGSYAAIHCVRTSTVCGHRRCFNLGNFQIECVRHYETTVDEYTVAGEEEGGADRFPGKYVSTYALPALVSVGIVIDTSSVDAASTTVDISRRSITI